MDYIAPVLLYAFVLLAVLWLIWRAVRAVLDRALAPTSLDAWGDEHEDLDDLGFQ